MFPLIIHNANAFLVCRSLKYREKCYENCCENGKKILRFESIEQHPEAIPKGGNRYLFSTFYTRNKGL